MGITIEVHRQRIGCYNCRGPKAKAVLCTSPICPGSSTGFPSFRFFLVIAMLLLIAGVEPNPGPDHLCKYCKKTFQDIALFCEHSKIHQSSKNFSILCGFPNCSARLSSVPSYRTHVSRSHTSKAMPRAAAISTPRSLPCPVHTCTERITSRQFYSKHMVNDHLKKGYSFKCIFEGCESVFSYVNQFRTHLSRYHRDDDAVYVAPESEGSDNVTELNDGNYVSDPLSDDDDISHSCNLEEETDLYPDSLIKESIAKFYLKLESVHVLASSIVQSIADELKDLTELSHYRLKKALFEELKKTTLEKDVIASIVHKTFKEDTVFNVHHKHEDMEQLGTNWSRRQYWQKYFPFVELEEINLGTSDTGKNSKAQYVSIRQSLEILLKDPKIKAAVLKSFDYKGSNDEILTDYMDGTAYQEHLKQHGGSPCLHLFLFQDAFDFNPFGPSSGVYKPVGFYFSLGNLPAVYRSKVDLIQLVYMILENDFKPTQEEELKDFDKVKHALKPMLDELKDLKTNGIEIDGKKIPVCLLFLLGDSLGQNTVGGYVKNFSSSPYSCRFCTMSKEEFRSAPFETKPLRTVQEYDNHLSIAKRKWCKLRKEGLKARKKAKQQAKRNAQKIANRSSAPSKKNLKGLISKSAYQKMCRTSFRGVKYRPSAFNSNDFGFHVVGHQPPCLAHDLFEGIVKSVVAHVLKYCIETKEWFDLACLNRRIKAFKCKGADAKDAPAKMKSLDKLGGNAVQNWNMLRFLPLIISDLIQDYNDPMWQLFLLLKQICEFVCAPKISIRQVSYLQHLIELYLAKLQDLLPSLLTEKQHYLCHYPDLILIFGPLIRLFTLRFESKHSFFKTVMRACKSFNNVTYTMANKYVCRFAYDHGSADLLPLDIVYNSNFTVGVNPDLLTDSVKNVFPENYDWSDVEELQRVFINGIDYSRGFVFVLGSEGTSLRVGCIEKIFLQRSNSTVQFFIEEKLAENTFNGFYIIKTKNSSYQVATLAQLPDYYALPTYDFEGNECLVLKHSVITME